MGDSRDGIDRRGFLGLAAATSAVAATGLAAVGCQGGPGDTPAAAPPPPTKPSSGEVAFASPLRTAVVPDDVPPAFAFHPMPRSR